MAIYRDTGVFCLSITGTENFQYRPLLVYTYVEYQYVGFYMLNSIPVIKSCFVVCTL